MKDIRITEPRQIIKHEILCPKGDLEEKKWGKKKMEDRSLEDMERNRRKKRKCPKINQLFKIEILIEIMKEDKEMKIKT